MATQLTINITPLAINPAYRPILWNVTSADATIKAVRADVYINGAYTSTIDGVQELGSTDIFDFDVRKIVQGSLNSELRTNITTLQIADAVTSACSVKLRLFEVVLTAGVHTHTWLAGGQGTNYLETSTYNAVNMATQHNETLADWTVDDATKKLLTLRTDNTKVPRGVPFQIGFLSSDSNLQISLITRDVNLNTINTYVSAINASLTYGKGICEIPAANFTTAAFMDFKVIKNSVGDRSETIRYKIADVCNPYPIFWQNHLGCFDHFDFGNEQKTKTSTRNQELRKPLPTTYSPEDASAILVNTEVTTKIKLTTAALSAAELTFLGYMVKNHNITYKWESAGVFYRNIIKSHSTKIEDDVKLINTISLTIEPSNDHIVQQGN